MRARSFLVLLASLTLAAAPASAGIYERVLAVYEANGQLPPCQFTSQQLTAALRGVDAYGAQYFADFTEAVQAALTERASGDCSGARASSGTGRLSHGRVPALRLPASATSPTASGIPAPILAMAAIALLAMLAVSLRTIARSSGWEPSWAPAWRHGWAEAGYRIAGRMARARDALRGVRPGRRERRPGAEG